MMKLLRFFLWLGSFGMAACASTSSQLAAQAPTATETALARGRFDLSCPTAIAEVLSSDYIQPAVSGRWVGSGVTRLEYTVGVEGCGKKDIYIVMCQEGSNTCVAAQSHGAPPQTQ